MRVLCCIHICVAARNGIIHINCSLSSRLDMTHLLSQLNRVDGIGSGGLRHVDACSHGHNRRGEDASLEHRVGRNSQPACKNEGPVVMESGECLCQ